MDDPLEPIRMPDLREAFYVEREKLKRIIRNEPREPKEAETFPVYELQSPDQDGITIGEEE